MTYTKVITNAQTGKTTVVPLTQDEIILPSLVEIELQKKETRYNSYIKESDPLFFKWQRGEIDKQVWLDKVAEIKAKYL